MGDLLLLVLPLGSGEVPNHIRRPLRSPLCGILVFSRKLPFLFPVLWFRFVPAPIRAILRLHLSGGVCGFCFTVLWGQFTFPDFSKSATSSPSLTWPAGMSPQLPELPVWPSELHQFRAGHQSVVFQPHMGILRWALQHFPGWPQGHPWL